MQIREILADIEAAISNSQHIAANSELEIQTRAKADQLLALKPQLKALGEQKKAIARSFRNLAKMDPQFGVQKAEMQLVSSQIKQLEKKRRQEEASLLAVFTPKASPPKLPCRFRQEPPANIADLKFVVQICNDDGIWDKYVKNHPGASVYHFYQWLTVINNSFGHLTIPLAAIHPDGSLGGILPITVMKSRLFGSFAVSMPFFNYGGPLANTIVIEHALLNEAARICGEQSLEHLEIRSLRSLNSWPVRKEKVSMILSLPNTTEQLDKNLGSKLRAQINQAKVRDFTFKSGDTSLLDDFYRVFSQNMRDLGTPVYSKKFFLNILNTFPSLCTLIVMYDQQRPIATAFLIGYGEVMEIPWASTLRTYNRFNANMILYRFVLGYAVKNGYACFDFGRSTKNESTYRFKKQWGAKPVSHCWHYWLPGGKPLPSLNPNNPKFRVLIYIWQRLPVFLTRLLGPGIVKSLP